MNYPIDLERLRGVWSTLDVPLEARLRLDAAALREQLSARAASAFSRHAWRQSAALLLNAGVLALLVIFMVRHAEVLHLLAFGAVCAAVVLVQVGVDAWEIVVLRRLDFTAPVGRVQHQIGAVRRRRVQLVKWILLLSPVLGLPAACVLLQAGLGIDFFALYAWRFFFWYELAGLACIPLLLLLSNAVARRFRDTPRFERFLDELVGSAWAAAQRQLGELRNFAADTDAQAASRTFALRARHAAVASAVATPYTALVRVLSWRLAYFGTALAGLTLLNLSAGGEARFLVPSLSLHFALLAHLIATIAQRAALPHLPLADPAAAQRVLERLARMQARLMRGTLLVAPLLVLPLAIVLTSALGGDLYSVFGTRSLVAGELAAAAAVAVLVGLFLLRGGVAQQPRRLIDRIAASSVARIRGLIAALERAALIPR